MDYRIVIPVLDPMLGHQCLTALDRVDHDRVIVVDNAPTPWDLPWQPGHYHRTGRNAGVAWSWNVGARQVVRTGADMLVICSQAVRMLDGGRSLLDVIHDETDPWGFEVVGAAWHLCGLTRHTLETVGPFDEGFWPAYFEETCYLYRMGLAGLPSPRENGRTRPYRVVDYADAGSALMVSTGKVEPNWSALQARYEAKWGGPQGSERFSTPWDSGKPIWWWPESPYPEHDPWELLS